MVYVPFRPGPWASHVACTGARVRPGGARLAATGENAALDATAAVFDVHAVRDEIDRSLLRERLFSGRSRPCSILALGSRRLNCSAR